MDKSFRWGRYKLPGIKKIRKVENKLMIQMNCRLTALRLVPFLVFFLFASVWAWGQEGRMRFTNHGPQLFASMIQGSAFARDRSGSMVVYTVVRGEPAHLLGFEVESGNMIVNQPLPEADGAWDLVQATDGTVYVPGANGNLFALVPGATEVKDLGVVLEGESYLWSLTAGSDGEVFGASYPGCRVFRYHPQDGFSDVGQGPLVEGQRYVRSLVYYPAEDLLYAGVGSSAHLLELNPRTGEKREFLPEEFRSKEFVYGLEIVRGSDGDDRLLVLVTNGATTLVYNLATGLFEQEIHNVDLRAAVDAEDGSFTYLTLSGDLWRFDASKDFASAERVGEGVGTANAFYRSEAGLIYFLTSGAELRVLNPADGSMKRTKLDIPGQPIPIHSLGVGPDGKVWSGGYLAGGNAAFDPISGTSTFLHGLEQTEGMSVMGSKIYFGVYPKGRFYSYSTQTPWSVNSDNPRFLGQIADQSRAFAHAVIPASREVVFGTIPEYGKLGGSIVVYNENKDELTAYDTPVKNQAISALAYTGSYLLVGTTVSGGLGKAPETKDAHLLGWDRDSGEVLFQFTPVEGASAVTGFLDMGAGIYWVMADGHLVVFNSLSRKIESVTKLYDYPPLGSHVWRSAFLVKHPDGYVYGTDLGKLFRIDSKELSVQVLAEQAGLLVMSADGTLFFRRKTELWSLQIDR